MNQAAIHHRSRVLPSDWDQTAPRAYITNCLCFPLGNSSNEAIRELELHLVSSLDGLATQLPDLAGHIQVNPVGQLEFVSSMDGRIPFQFSILDNPRSNFYAELKDRGFPQGELFQSKVFNTPLISDTSLLPVLIVRAVVVPGGLLLGIFAHHGFMDGEGMTKMLECLGAQTRRQQLGIPTKKELEFPFPDENAEDPCVDGFRPGYISRFEFPEFEFDSHCRGPTQPIVHESDSTPMSAIPTTGKIFVFSAQRLAELKEAVVAASEPGMSIPSTYTSLAALAWARIAQARISTETFRYTPVRLGHAWMSNPVNWRPRAFPASTAGYFGNCMAKAITELTETTIMRVGCDSSLRGLAALVTAIQSALSSVDADFVHSRTRLFRRLDDPRHLGLRWDPRRSADLNFNSWRHLGIEAQWNLPGVSVTYPDAVRKLPAAEWGMGDALILPGRKDSAYELLVMLPMVSMEALCKDEEWLKWVGRVVD